MADGYADCADVCDAIEPFGIVLKLDDAVEARSRAQAPRVLILLPRGSLDQGASA